MYNVHILGYYEEVVNVVIEEKLASPIHIPANEPDLSSLPYTPSSPVYGPPSSVNPAFLHLLFLNHQTRTATSGSLIHQHDHPGMMPSLLHCICTLHQCTLHPMQSSPMWLLKKKKMIIKRQKLMK